MIKRNARDFLKRTAYVAMLISLSAFTVPQKDGLVEITGFLNARSGAQFRETDQNRIYVLKPGTRGKIKETKLFSETQNYGLCLEVQSPKESPSSENCVWVYYDLKNPALKLFSESQTPELSPDKASSAQTVRTISAVADNRGAQKKKSAPEVATDSETLLKTGIQSVDQFNRSASQAMTPTTSQTCADCKAASLRTFETCTTENIYLEQSLTSILNQPVQAAFYQQAQKEIIRGSCIQRNMSVFPKSSAFFRSCSPGQASAGARTPKACISEKYVDVTAKAFNLSADCLGGYVSGNDSTKGQVALSLFSLMSLESGMHVNAMSATGPGGPGQMSGPAIAAVNQEMASLRAHLAASNNPNCSNILAKSLANPMSSTATCERISIHQDNPLKSMAYAFAYQAISRRVLERQAFHSSIFRGVISDSLPALEKERLIMEVSAWSHNTGPAGMLSPLRGLLMFYMQNGKKVETASDVDLLLKDLRQFLASHAHPANRSRSRVTETMNYYKNIQTRMASIAQEPKSCLAN